MLAKDQNCYRILSVMYPITISAQCKVKIISGMTLPIQVRICLTYIITLIEYVSNI